MAASSSAERRSPTPMAPPNEARATTPLDAGHRDPLLRRHDDATFLTPRHPRGGSGPDRPRRPRGPLIFTRRLYLLVPCILTLALAAGPVLGLPALFDTLVDRHMFHDECTPVPVNTSTAQQQQNATFAVPATCTAQHNALENAADLALSLQSGSALFSGILIDLIGGKWSAVVHGLVWMASAAAAGLQPNAGNVFLIATTLYAAAGSGWFVSILLHHVRYVFPRERDYKLLNPLFTGIFNAASLTTLGLRYFFAWQVLTLPEAYMVYGLGVGAPLVLFMMWFPSKLPPPPPEAEEDGVGPAVVEDRRPATVTKNRSRANSSHLARRGGDDAHATGALGRSPLDINGTPNHSMQTHVGVAADGTRVYRRNREGLLTDSDSDHDDHHAEGGASGRTPNAGRFRAMVARMLGGRGHGDAGDDSQNHFDRDDPAADDDILFESVDRMGAYGAVGLARPHHGAVAVRHDGRDVRGGARGTPATGKKTSATVGLAASAGRSRSASPAGAGALGASGNRTMPSTVVADTAVAADDDDEACAADTAQLMMLLKTGSNTATTPRQRAWARVRLAASASRKIVRQPMYWALCAHSVATVTVGFFFISNTGSLYRFAGATESEQSWARDSVAAGIGVFAGVAFFAGVFMRAFGPVRGITVAAICNATCAAVFTAMFITVLPGSAADAATAAGKGLTGYQHAALLVGYAAVLLARILGFAVLNLGAPMLFAEHPMGVGLALGGALSVGGGTSAGVGRALSNLVHSDPHRAYPPVIAGLGIFFVVAEVLFIVAVRRGHREADPTPVAASLERSLAEHDVADDEDIDARIP